MISAHLCLNRSGSESVSGTYVDASDSGSDYAEAFVSIAINNESGQGWFSGVNDTDDPCWDDGEIYAPFNDLFNIFNNTPVVTGINPSNWVAGQTTYAVAFAGAFFGTNIPTLAFSPGGGITYSLQSYNDTQIVADITVASGTPDEDVTVTVTNNGYGGFGFKSNGGTIPQTSSGARASVYSPLTNPEITVIAWVDDQAPDLLDLINNHVGVNATLIDSLNSSSSSCADRVADWSIFGSATNLFTQNDRDYANAFLVAKSHNPPPPPTINVPDQYNLGNYRLFHDWGTYTQAHQVGKTPDPCKSIVGWIASAFDYDEGETSYYMGFPGTSLSGNIYQVAEGRIGPLGQKGSLTINGRTVPWIYDVIEFDSSGGYSVIKSSFPTFSVYKNRTRQYIIPQSSTHDFIYSYDSSNQTAWSPVP
jgi:hypothetical protein